MMCCIRKIVRTGKCFGLKQWQLLSLGDSFSCGQGDHKFVMSFSKGGRTSMTKCDKRGLRSLLRQSSMTSFLDDPCGHSYVPVVSK
jgi:hypothetical protein